MKHQITFIGGQVLPIFVGIKEYSPDKIHFIVSEESKDKINLLKPLLDTKIYSEIICNAYDFISIKEACEEIINRLEPTDEISFNMTGGTKIMVLAAQSLIQKGSGEGFYLNPDNTILKLPSYTFMQLTCEISVREFLDLSGHKINSFKLINYFAKEDFLAANKISSFANLDKTFSIVATYFRKNFDDIKKIPQNGNVKITEKIICIWDRRKIVISKNGTNIFKANSQYIRDLFFNSAWWEIIVAKKISEWTKVRELLIQCKLPFRGDIKILKNEIDILVNTGRKLIFVECKSGIVKQEDINKMKIIKDTYGGIISKSILVSRFLPSKNILEKCKELNIEVFHQYEDKILVNELSKLVNTLEEIEKKLTL